MSYATPVRDIRYALKHMAGFDALAATGGFDALADELLDAILEEMARYCDEVVAPLNQDADRNGARLEGRAVVTPPGFREAYRAYVEGGWNALAFPESAGGQGLPSALALVLVDALNAACMAFAINTSLTTGAAKAVQAVGTDEQKRLYLKHLATGAWTGAMNLTEPQAGSDLSGIKTRAQPTGDGRYRIAGQKIYITYGDHDLTDNVVHLVLARLPDAAEGTRGISMFLVPKFRVNGDGSLGGQNDVHCIGLERKLGLHGSPTSVMAFGESGECEGTLLGAENEGMKNMFIMMNSARLDVGMQGVGVAERAFQQAMAYAQDRRQGRAPGIRTGAQVAIYEHPDVRRMLYSMKALTDAARGICYATAVAYDLARTSPDKATRARAAGREGLLTPIAKAWSTDRANEIASIGVQVHGGMGYVEETGAAQHLRDARIAAIYEGTNGIQAIDLVGRKLQGDGGAAAKQLIAQIRSTAVAAKASANASVAQAGAGLERAVEALSLATSWLLETAASDRNAVLAGASPYLRQFGNVAGGFYLLRGALSALDAGLAAREMDYRLTILRFYADNYLSEAEALTPAVTAGSQSLARIDPEIVRGS